MSDLPPQPQNTQAANSFLLATDLDGTLIPLNDHPENQHDLRVLAAALQQRRGLQLAFVTGRHFQSVLEAMREHVLPQPQWIICDVGTSIYESRGADTYKIVDAYQSHQQRITASLPHDRLRDVLSQIAGMRLQEPEKQGRFKLSYYVAAAQLAETVLQVQQQLDRAQAPYAIVQSVDPFNGDGLIDLLPAGVSKAHALDWLALQWQWCRESVLFAGDSGNDLAAFTAGYRAIVVANADQAVARQAHAEHQRQGWTNRLYLAQRAATSGVLEGCRWFGIL